MRGFANPRAHVLARELQAPGVAFDALPKIDVVLISLGGSDVVHGDSGWWAWVRGFRELG
jgi:hypothetical protein